MQPPSHAQVVRVNLVELERLDLAGGDETGTLETQRGRAYQVTAHSIHLGSPHEERHRQEKAKTTPPLQHRSTTQPTTLPSLPMFRNSQPASFSKQRPQKSSTSLYPMMH